MRATVGKSYSKLLRFHGHHFFDSFPRCFGSFLRYFGSLRRCFRLLCVFFHWVAHFRHFLRRGRLFPSALLVLALFIVVVGSLGRFADREVGSFLFFACVLLRRCWYQTKNPPGVEMRRGMNVTNSLQAFRLRMGWGSFSRKEFDTYQQQPLELAGSSDEEGAE
ncbi:unnamed protein product, partial [Amoebophrya sp. A25]|eukprot:GSA25T00014531001.1